MSDEGVWPCAKCGALMFSGNLFAHDCRPSATPVLDWGDEPESQQGEPDSLPTPQDPAAQPKE